MKPRVHPMLTIDPPDDDAAAVFLTCISKIEDAALKGRLTALGAAVGDANTDYQAKARNATLHTVPRNAPLASVTDDEMEGVYHRMLYGPGRDTYDQLLARAGGKCPLCAQRGVGSLDHHLPKKKYPIYAVMPINLVPACNDCNKVKWQSYPTSPQTQTLHPYFDDVTSERWLFGEVIPGTPAGFNFRVIAPPVWVDPWGARLEHHLKLFKLANLYAFHAVELMSNMNGRLRKLSQAGGMQAVRDHLLEEAVSCAAANRNSWQTATYYAMADSDWFCAGGYQV